MEQGSKVYLVTRGIYSDETAAGIYPSLDRAKGQFPGVTWREGLFSTLYAEDVVVGHWGTGAPIIDGVTIYELSFDQDVVER